MVKKVALKLFVSVVLRPFNCLQGYFHSSSLSNSLALVFFLFKRNIYDFRDLNLPADNMDNRTVTLSCYGPGLSGMLGDVQEDVEMDPPPRRLADGGSDWCWF